MVTKKYKSTSVHDLYSRCTRSTSIQARNAILPLYMVFFSITYKRKCCEIHLMTSTQEGWTNWVERSKDLETISRKRKSPRESCHSLIARNLLNIVIFFDIIKFYVVPINIGNLSNHKNFILIFIYSHYILSISILLFVSITLVLCFCMVIIFLRTIRVGVSWIWIVTLYLIIEKESSLYRLYGRSVKGYKYL